MVIFKGKHTAFLTTDIPRVEELGKYVARFWLILIWRACLFKANVNNFPKKRTQAVTSTVNYCPIGNSSALELWENSIQCVLGWGRRIGWVSESYCQMTGSCVLASSWLWTSGLCLGRNWLSPFASWKIL